jgi:hypothetical protein
MAYCAIKKKPDGSLDRVVTPNGNASVLYDRIAGIPHVEKEEDALNIYKNVLSEPFVKRFGRWYESPQTEQDGTNPLKYSNGEPRLFFSNGEVITANYAEALKSSRQTTIEAGFIASNDFVEVGSAESLGVPTNEVVFYQEKIALNDRSKFIPVMQISTDRNPSTRNGLINYLIAGGYLAGV